MGNNIYDSHFEDVADELEGMSGIFGGEGYSSMNRVNAKMAKDGSGYVYSMICQGCSRQLNVSVTWDELLTIAARQKPLDRSTGRPWVYDPNRGGVYPPGIASCCNSPVPLLITAQEAEQRVNAGMHAQKLSPQYVQNAMAQLGHQQAHRLGPQRR